MDVVTLGAAKAADKDFRGRPIRTLTPSRDLPGVLGHWDASLIPNAVGTGVNAIPDAGHRGIDLTRYTQSAAVSTVAAAPNGLKVARTNGTGYFAAIGWGGVVSGKTAGVIAPVTMICVAAAAATTPGTDRVMVSTQSGAGGTLTSASTAGAITFQSSVVFEVNARLVFDTLGSGLQEAADVIAVSGVSSPYTITVKSPLVFAHASGSAVTTMSVKLQLDSAGSSPQTTGNLGPSQKIGAGGTKPLNDGNLHVYVAVHDVNSVKLFCDGVVVADSGPDIASLFSIKDLYFGANGASTPLDGDLAELVVVGSALTPSDVVTASRSLAAKWGITLAGDGSKGSFTSRIDATSGVSSQQYRILPPPKTAGAHPLVIWSHPHAHTEAISQTYFAWPLWKAFNSAGYGVAASRMHSNSWGNTSALDDNVDLYNQYVSYFGTPSAVIMVGASMGGLASALAVPDGRIPNIKGVIGIDAVFSLAAIYANASYTSSINTAYGIAGDYASKTAGHDPLLKTAGSYGTTPFRIYTGATDAVVPTADHATPFAALVTGATERQVLTHAGAHLDSHAIWAADLLAFAQRVV